MLVPILRKAIPKTGGALKNNGPGPTAFDTNIFMN